MGIFGGLTINNGISEPILATQPVYGRATTIRRLYRIAPRIIYNAGKVRLAAELEYTSAAYGNNYDEYYIPADLTNANNMRVLLAVYYFF